MTLFAGIVARGPEAGAIPESVIASLALRLSRRAADHVQVDTGAGYALATVDTRAPGDGARRIGGGAISLLAGDPLLGAQGSADTRARDFDRLHEAWTRSDAAVLATARGAFCGVHLDTRQRRLWLVPDKLALRPIYYAMLDEYVAFASSLRALLECPLVPREGDLQGLVQFAAFGAALGERTRLAAVRHVLPARIVEVRPDALGVHEYWRWDGIESVDADDGEICRAIRAGFDEAVGARLGANRRAVSLLSGGLDSRCVAACLRERGATVDTIGFGPPGTADDVLAREVASAIGARHFAYTGEVARF